MAQAYLRSDKLNVTSLNPPGSLRRRQNSLSSRTFVRKLRNSSFQMDCVCLCARIPGCRWFRSMRPSAEVCWLKFLENNGITKLLSRALLKGTKERTSSQLAEEIESVGGRFSADSGNNSFSVNVEVMKPNLALGLDILADILQNPFFRRRRWLSRRRPKSPLSRPRTSRSPPWPETSCAKSSSANIRMPCAIADAPTRLEDHPADLMAFQKDYVVANNGVLAVFGDVKAEEVLKLVEKDFGTMPAGELALSQPLSPLCQTTYRCC